MKLAGPTVTGMVIVLLSASARLVQADMILSIPATPFTGPTQTKSGFPSPQGNYRQFDASSDLAYQGNGFAQAAVAKDTIAGFAGIHQAQFLNDGFYGNGSSWLSDSPNSWIKIDLGQVVSIDSVQFGRDRLGGFDDRDPGQFTVAYALTDNVYANGDATNDGAEYSTIFDSTLAGYSGAVSGPETLKAIFATAVSARYVKITFANTGTAIDEIELGIASVPEPTSTALMAIGVCFTFVRARRKSRTDDSRWICCG